MNFINICIIYIHLYIYKSELYILIIKLNYNYSFTYIYLQAKIIDFTYNLINIIIITNYLYNYIKVEFNVYFHVFPKVNCLLCKSIYLCNFVIYKYNLFM